MDTSDKTTCVRCGTNQRQRFSTGRFSYYCKPCNQQYLKKYNEKRKEARRIAKDERQKARLSSPCYNCGVNPRITTSHGELRAYCSECQSAFRRDNHLWKRYRITIKDYEDMMESQGWKCPICDEHFDESSPPVIDHCHEVGNIKSGFRGILHTSCNSAVGMLKENPESAIRASNYIASWHTEKKPKATSEQDAVAFRNPKNRMATVSRQPSKPYRRRELNISCDS